MSTSSSEIALRLTHSEALVLFEFLSRFSENKRLEILDLAEERVLWDLEAQLEKTLVEPFQGDYIEVLRKARIEVRDEI
jgi:hypothetical protein